MKKIIIALLLATILLATTACDQKIPTIGRSIANETTRITSKEFNDNFHREYSLNHLINHEVYFDGENVQAEFYFKRGVSDGELDAAYLFAVNKFIYHKYHNLNPGYYDEFMLHNLVNIEQKNLFLLIYVDGKIKRYEI